MERVLKAATGTEPKRGYKELLAERLQSGGFGSETDWTAHCILSGVPGLAIEAVATDTEDKDGVISQALCKVIGDRGLRPDLRALAIQRARPPRERHVLLALCAVANDGSPAFTKDCWPLLREGCPFANRLEVRIVRPMLERLAAQNPNASKTIWDLARAQLKKATKKDFGEDTTRWQDWIEANVR